MSELENWYLDNYGICTHTKCICLISGWKGRACVFWQSFGAKNPNELYLAQQQFIDAKIN